MTFLVRDGIYYDTMWSVQFEGGDYLAAIFKDEGVWQGKYRFRYYEDDKASDSDDVKNWYAIRTDDATEEARVKLHVAMKLVADATAKMYEGEVHTLLLKTDRADKIRAAFNRETFLHVEEEPQ
jgi:hypothetical protein